MNKFASAAFPFVLRSVYRSGNRDVIERLQIRKSHTWRYTHAHYDFHVRKLTKMASNVESTSNAAHSSVSFAVGEKFSCFTDFQKKLTEYERHNAVQLSCRDSRTLEAAAKRVPKRVLGAPSDLKYYEIQYTCLFGGKVYKRKGCGKRKHQRLVFVMVTYTCIHYTTVLTVLSSKAAMLV